MPTAKGPTAATRRKVERAIALLREAAKDPGNDWEASCAIDRAIVALRQAQKWEEQAERNRAALARQIAEERNRKRPNP